MKKALQILFTASLATGGLLHHANGGQNDQPPNIITSEMRQRLKEKDYPAVESIIKGIDAKFGANRPPAYYKELLAAVCDLTTVDDLYGAWLRERVLWKFVCEPFESQEDSERVWQFRVYAFDNGFRKVSADPAQLVALRRDRAALFEAYGDFLRKRIIPGYKDKPIRPMNSGVILEATPRDAAAIAREVRQNAEWHQNELDNDEQRNLRVQWRKIRARVIGFTRAAFSRPPYEPATVAEICDQFAITGDERESLLKTVEASNREQDAKPKSTGSDQGKER